MKWTVRCVRPGKYMLMRLVDDFYFDVAEFDSTYFALKAAEAFNERGVA